VEIGGSFRIPEVIQQGGARLREVGTTNRTRADDFDEAVSDASASHPARSSLEFRDRRLHRVSVDRGAWWMSPTTPFAVAV